MPITTKTLYAAASKSVPELVKWLIKNKSEHVIQMTFVDEKPNFLFDYDSKRSMLLNCKVKSDSELNKIFKYGARIMMSNDKPDYWQLAEWINKLACAYCEEFVLPYGSRYDGFLTAYWPVETDEHGNYDFCERQTCRILAKIPDIAKDKEVDVAVCQVPLDSGVSKECMIKTMSLIHERELLCLSAQNENAACEGFVGCNSAEKYGFDHTIVTKFLEYIMSDVCHESENGHYMLIQPVDDDYVRTRVSIQYDNF